MSSTDRCMRCDLPRASHDPGAIIPAVFTTEAGTFGCPGFVEPAPTALLEANRAARELVRRLRGFLS